MVRFEDRRWCRNAERDAPTTLQGVEKNAKGSGWNYVRKSICTVIFFARYTDPAFCRLKNTGLTFFNLAFTL